MANLEAPFVSTSSLRIAGMLAVVGACAYALVGGPLVYIGGFAVALALIAYRRRTGLWHSNTHEPTLLSSGPTTGADQPARPADPHVKLIAVSLGSLVKRTS